jgi:hypothetical protein
MAIQDWSTTAASNNSASPNGFPEGMAPGGVNDSAREVMAQVRRFAEGLVSATYGTDAGGDDAYAITPTIAPGSYTAGQQYTFTVTTANTGAATLNVNSLGAQTIVRRDGSTALSDGDIPANNVIQVVYDGTNFRLLSALPVTTALLPANNLSDVSSAATSRDNLGLETVSQAEAEAGTATTTRSWTAERVKQAIAALETNKLIQRVVTENTTYSAHTTTFPEDDTIPQNTEGAQIMTRAITPTATDTRLLITISVELFNGSGWGIGLFQDAGANALAATGGISAISARTDRVTFFHEMASGTTSSTTFSVRVGPNAGTVYINGDQNGRHFGGVLRSYLIVEEYAT